MLSEFEEALFAKLTLKRGDRLSLADSMQCPSCGKTEFNIVECEVYCRSCKQCVDPSMEIEEE